MRQSKDQRRRWCNRTCTRWQGANERVGLQAFSCGSKTPLCRAGLLSWTLRKCTRERLCSCLRTNQPTGQMNSPKAALWWGRLVNPTTPSPCSSKPAHVLGISWNISLQGMTYSAYLLGKRLTRQTEKEQGESWLSFSVPRGEIWAGGLDGAAGRRLWLRWRSSESVLGSSLQVDKKQHTLRSGAGGGSPRPLEGTLTLGKRWPLRFHILRVKKGLSGKPLSLTPGKTLSKSLRIQLPFDPNWK